jgi:hypothetical protein
MNDNRTHIVHERRSGHPVRTLGYRIKGSHNGMVEVIAAESRCHPNDNFNRETGRRHVASRLEAFESGARSPDLRAFEANISMDMPSNHREYRELEDTLFHLADIRLPTPAALER